MPLYDYKCPECGKRFERLLRLDDYDQPQQCECGGLAEKQLAAPAICMDYPGYVCPVTEKWIEGRRAHQENLARLGCRVLEPGEREAVVRNRQREDELLDKSVEETAEKLVASLPSRKLEQLASEMEAGVTATVERQ